MKVSLDEFRVAIHQTQNCQAGCVAEIMEVTASVDGIAPWRGAVHVFEVSGHRSATHCFAWPSQLDPATTIIHAVLKTGRTLSAEQAVRSVLRREARRSIP